MRPLAVLLLLLWFLPLMAEPSFALSTKDLKGDCKTSYEAWRKKDGYGAFALGTNGYCAGTSDSRSLENARKGAVERCRDSGKGKGCVVVDVNKSPSEYITSRNVCREANGQKSIDACTWLIKLGRDKGRKQADNYNNRGVAQHKMRLIDGAMKDYASALSVDATYGAASVNLARIFEEQSRYDEAIRTAKGAIDNYRAGNSDYRADARDIIKRSEAAKVPKPQPSPALTKLDDKELCNLALKPGKSAFETGPYAPHAEEARRRGYSADTCRKLVLPNLPASPQTARNVNLNGLSDKKVCVLALTADQSGFETGSFEQYAQEASRRGYDAQSCRNLVSLPKVQLAGTNSTASLSDQTLCKIALGKDKQAFDWRPAFESAVNEARKRNLDPEACRAKIRVLATENEPATSIASERDVSICVKALQPMQPAWDTSGKYLFYIVEAGRRELTIDDCRRKLQYTVSGKPYKPVDREICVAALNQRRDGWNTSASGTWAQAVASKRNLTFSKCADLTKQLDISKLEAFLQSNSPSDSLSGLNNQELCSRALRPDKSAWETLGDPAPYIREAGRRELGVNHCRKLLGLMAADVVPALTDADVCTGATNAQLSAWGTSGEAIWSQAVAQKRNLSLDWCIILADQQFLRSTDQTKLIAESDAKICRDALTIDKTRFETRAAFAASVREAQRRKFTPATCVAKMQEKAASVPQQASVSSEADGSVCMKAIMANQSAWDESGNFIPHIVEAGRRELTIADCRSKLGYSVAVREAKRPDNEICALAMNNRRDGWGITADSFWAQGVAGTRGLTLASCRNMLDGGTAAVGNDKLQEEEVCRLAVNANVLAWEDQIQFAKFVFRAGSAGLSLNDCLKMMGFVTYRYKPSEIPSLDAACLTALDATRTAWSTSPDGVWSRGFAESKGMTLESCVMRSLASAKSDIPQKPAKPRQKIYDRIGGDQEVLSPEAPIVISPGSEPPAIAAKSDEQPATLPTPPGSAVTAEGVLNKDADPPSFGNRIALVIGNSKYAHAPALENTDDDAALMASALERAGFKVTRVDDADQKAMKRAMIEFGRSLRKGADASLFYYAGHGVEVEGQNFLIPVDAEIADETEVQINAVSVSDFLQTMENSSSLVNIVVLDSCRENPFARASRGLSRGLAPVDAPGGTYILYSTSPGKVADDGDGRNSPFTAALAEAIIEPGIKIEEAFKRTRKKVVEATGKRQMPWETSSLTGDFYFIPPQ